MRRVAAPRRDRVRAPSRSRHVPRPLFEPAYLTSEPCSHDGHLRSTVHPFICPSVGVSVRFQELMEVVRSETVPPTVRAAFAQLLEHCYLDVAPLLPQPPVR